MSGRPPSPKGDGSSDAITILLVDDIADTRESIKKLLAFESDFKVIGSAANGRDGVEQAKALKPDIVIMDINMPDMDGLEAAGLITKAVPATGVIMMSVQNDPDYMQKAMLAGARFFLSKPVDMDQLYNTIRSVYQQYAGTREMMKRMSDPSLIQQQQVSDNEEQGDRAGHIVVVYSPQGGAGTTTIATSLASGLMKEGIRVLLIDADLEFGDVGAFLAMQSQSTLMELAPSVDDLDVEFFDSIAQTHETGLKVLLGPPRPAMAADIRENYPDALPLILKAIRTYYDFIVIDTSKALDAHNVSLFDLASQVILVANPTLPSIKNIRLVLDVFDQLEYPKDKTLLMINRYNDDRSRKKATLAAETIEKHLKRPVEATVPAVDERLPLMAINKGVPLIASDRDRNKPHIQSLVHLSDLIFHKLMGAEEEEDELTADAMSKDKRWSLFGNR